MTTRTAQTILESLNPAQRQAVTCIDGPLLMLAGPGSGKTRVITHRIAYMIDQGIATESILALTFTNKAAEEMKKRLQQLVTGRPVWAGTFHRFCAQLLRRYATMLEINENFTIYDRNDSKKVVKQALTDTGVGTQHFSPNHVLERIGALKSKGVTASDFRPRPGDMMDAILERVYPAYQQLLQTANAVDFDDLLLSAVDLLRHNPELRAALDLHYQYVMVDEYQDTNRVQYMLIRLLNHDTRNLGVTGDPDQSIYGWRGADLNNILDFKQDYAGAQVVRLEQNYRSTQAILGVADQLILNNSRRMHKQLISQRGAGERVALVAFHNSDEEATTIAETIRFRMQQDGVQPKDFAVFYRVNYLSRALEHAFRQDGIPYQVVNGHEFYQRREIKDMLAYLQLINNPRDNVALERVINVPPRKIGKVTLSRIRDYARANGLSLLEAARQAGLIKAISKAAATKVLKFVTLYDQLCAAATRPVAELLQTVTDQTGYQDWLIEDGSDEGHERSGNVDELIVAAHEFDLEHPEDGSLDTYLEQTSLVSDTDTWESETNCVSLMTLHASKGLEFEHVFIIGCEDGLLPHERSTEEDWQLEEERRLMFVGITRAKTGLQLSRCMRRMRRGEFWPAIPSRFLMELPRHDMEIHEPGSDDPIEFDAYDHDNDDIPFQIDPWLHDGIQVDDSEPSPDSVVSEELGGESDRSRTETSGSGRSFPRLMTGADLEAQAAIRIHPSRFETGMRVHHEEYGDGTIVRLSGASNKRTATIEFDRMGRKRFRLAYANLQIVERPSPPGTDD